MTLRIANAAGFWGDDIDAPRRLVESANVDYLTLEYLAELTMSILAHQRSKDPRAGFASDVLTALRDVIPALKRQSNFRIVTNAGGVNPVACAGSLSAILVEAGLGDEKIAVVTGDDLLTRLVELQAEGCDFANLDSGQSLRELQTPVVVANAYLGAESIAIALSDGARIVVTGRVADASLTVGPVVHQYGWDWDDWNRLAAATVAGHLIECGAQVTGGYSDRWREINLVNIGYPIAEIQADGTTVITKPAGSGGIVDRRSVVEQLVYEIGDPAAYYTPDVIADFTSVEVAELEKDHVRVWGATGRAASETYKVSLAYQSGYMSSGQLLIRGPDAFEKARFVGELILARLRNVGVDFQQTNIECLGAGDGIPRGSKAQVMRDPLWMDVRKAVARMVEVMKQADPEGAGVADAEEIVLRVTVRDPNRAAVERFSRDIAPLITNGPSGLAGYASGRPAVRPVLAYWPTLVPKSAVSAKVEIQSAKNWLSVS